MTIPYSLGYGQISLRGIRSDKTCHFIGKSDMTSLYAEKISSPIRDKTLNHLSVNGMEIRGISDE